MHILALHAVMCVLSALRSCLSLKLLQHYLLLVFSLLFNYSEATLRTPLSLICIREFEKKNRSFTDYSADFSLSLVVGFGQLFVFIWVFTRMSYTVLIFWTYILGYVAIYDDFLFHFVLILLCF